MIQTISVNPPEKLRAYAEIKLSGGVLDGFPFLSIDRDSYIVQAKVQSGINFRPKEGRHCLAIGKGCSLADDITFMIDLNHDYRAVCQGSSAFLDGIVPMEKTPRKSTISLDEARNMLDVLSTPILVSGSSVSPLEAYYAADAALTGCRKSCLIS